MLKKIKKTWDLIQDLLDVRGDCVMLVFSLAIIMRIVATVFGHAPLTVSEAAVYGSAVTAFAWSNKGPKGGA